MTAPLQPSPLMDLLSRPVGRVGIIGLGLYFLLLSAAGFQVLIGVWPGRTQPSSLFGVLTFSVDPDIDLRLILVSLTAGALGSFVHSATSFATFLGNRKLIRSWIGWYLLRPLIGMALALLFYFIVRGGFLSTGASGASLSPYGVAAVSGLVGMFSKEATDKLREVFKNLFKPPEEDEKARGDKLQ